MGIGVHLQGRSDTEGWIDELRERLSELTHPAAEPIEVTDDGIVSAATTPVGPGYHVALCEALDAAARDLAIRWDPPEDDGGGDETGYFHDRDLPEVERHMLQWLRTVATWVLEQDQPDRIQLAMPLGHSYLLDGIHTPTGPRDLAWFRAVVEDPRRGVDFFPWWTRGKHAASLLGRARCQMWTEIRWRDPNTEDEEDAQYDVVTCLEDAWALDPSLDYPAREWCELDDAPREIVARAQAAAGPRIGYRRHPVRVSLAGGWSVEIPGEFSEEWEDGTWSGWHDGRTVWFDGYERDGVADELVESAPAEGEVLRRRDGDVVKKAYLSRGDDGFVLATRNAVDGKLCISTIAFSSEDQRPWAIEAWASIRHAGRATTP